MEGDSSAPIDQAVNKPSPLKPNKLTDGKGLYALVNAADKYWRDKRLTLARGLYPDVSLAPCP